MLKQLSTIALSLFLVTSIAPVHAEAVVKEVCRDKVGKDGKPVVGKDGKKVQECKKIKTHKKAEPTGAPK